MKKGVFPTPFCELFQVHRSIFKPHPACDPGQTSMMRITHSVFFFCVGKNTFNCLFAHGVYFFSPICSPQLFYQIQVLLPDVRHQHFLAFFIRTAFFFVGAILAMLRIAAVRPFSFFVCSGVSQYSTVRTYIAVLFGVILVFPRSVYVFLVVVVCVRENGDSAIVNCLLCYPRGFENGRIYCLIIKLFCFRY